MFFLLLFTNLYDSFTDKRAKDFSRRVEQFEEKQGMYVVPLSYRSCYIWSSRCCQTAEYTSPSPIVVHIF